MSSSRRWMPPVISTPPSGKSTVRSRFWGDGEETGYLSHKPGGPEHARWIFDYHQTTRHENERGYRFGTHIFRFGEYVSIQDEAGELHTFRVVSVAPVV
jgi:hypothetical protein